MADLYNLDAELQQGLLGTEDDNAHLVNTAISTDEEQPNHHSTPHTTSMEQDDDDDDEMEASTSGYQSMSTVPVALREAAMERQKNRRGGDQHHDDNESDDGTNVQNHPNKGHWDTSKTDSYLFDSLQQQQQQEEKRNYEKQLQNLPYTHLYQAWTQERQAPELLPYPYETIQHIREGLIRYENYTFQDQQQQQQPGDVNHHGRRRGRHTNENLNALMESLLRIDAERVKFLLSDLLKRRIQKITLHPQYYTKLVAEETTVPREAEQEVNDHHEEQHHPLLCPAEVRLQFQRIGSNSVSVLFLTFFRRSFSSYRIPNIQMTLLQKYMKMMQQHLSTTVTDHFPQEVWRTLDIPNDSVHEPNIPNQYVFIRCREHVTIPNPTPKDDPSPTTEDGRYISQDGQPQQAGQCLIVRYERIRHLLLQGKVELM